MAVTRDGEDKWDSFYFCRMLKYAYDKAFTLSNIVSGFRRAGIVPIDASQLLSVPRPRSADDVSLPMTVEEIEGLFEEKRVKMRHAISGKTLRLAQVDWSTPPEVRC